MRSSIDSQTWVRALNGNDPEYSSALHLAVIGTIPKSGREAPEVHNLLEGQNQKRLCIRPVVGAFVQGRLVSSVSGVESPGSANLLLMPFESGKLHVVNATGPALRRALQLSRKYGVALSQVVAPQSGSNWDNVLSESGMIPLANLVYLMRPTDESIADPRPRSNWSGLNWINYSLELEALFCEALAQSYFESQDCPKLSGIRTPYQALLTHRSTGGFHPNHWFVLVEGEKPLGIVLLSLIPSAPIMEVVYMGVSQPARGKGFAGLLMERALRVASQAGAASMILAVDEHNVPARRLYARWSFHETARRAAWIANLYGVER